MITLDQSIPREYLALKINYCRQQLKLLPEIKLHVHNINGKEVKRVLIGTHRYNLESDNGKELYQKWFLRDQIQRQLQIYEAVWDSNFKGIPLPECTPHQVRRTLCIDAANRVVMDKTYFDSLENDANKEYPKPPDYPFNGIYYRSAAEREIAIFYTEMGIPFKYEPAVTIKDVPGVIHPDFVIYIPELDNCKFHEHFGMKDSAKYLRITNTKYYNYTNAGLVPELDIIFTHDVKEIPFDIRYVSSKINTAIYGTMIGTKQ
ncbi:MAG: hypothetical protein K6E12_00680 [Saccharofermentans sp.]|nr:hypothetical protein [Saccharofermentans sp.]